MQLIAIIACVLAAGLGAVSVMAHNSSLHTVVGYVTDVWTLSWIITNKVYTREYWTAINRPIREVINAPPRATSGLARVMTFGMVTLVILNTVLMFRN